MIRFLVSFGVLLALAMASGCVTSGTQLAREDVDQIERGVTTRAEVEERLGAPDYVAMMGDGRRMLSYHYTSAKSTPQSFIPYYGVFRSSATTKRQYLQIVVSANGVVEDYEFSDKEGVQTAGLLGQRSEERPVAAAP